MKEKKNNKECYYYLKTEDCKVICNLCPNNCIIEKGKTGKCRVRYNNNGILYSLNYGEVSSLNIDPIEKKPIKNFMENTKTLSLGTYSCNFHCSYCQNHEISMKKPKTLYYEPDRIIELAIENRIPSISYTYNEPIIYYEYMLDISKMAKENSLKNIIVTNGYINKEPLEEILKYTDAMNIDLKCFSKNKYKNFFGGELEQIIKNIVMAANKCHVEVSILVVPTINDNILEAEEVLKELSYKAPNITLHFTRYFPRYKFNESATDINKLLDMQIMGRKYFKYVYLGNV